MVVVWAVVLVVVLVVELIVVLVVVVTLVWVVGGQKKRKRRGQRGGIVEGGIVEGDWAGKKRKTEKRTIETVPGVGRRGSGRGEEGGGIKGFVRLGKKAQKLFSFSLEALSGVFFEEVFDVVLLREGLRCQVVVTNIGGERGKKKKSWGKRKGWVKGSHGHW